MLSRREVLVGMAAAGATFRRRAVRDPAPTAATVTPLTFSVPSGACDCHTHVIGEPRRFPLSPERRYTPESASVEELRDLHRSLHVERVVIVQPSVYGTDNACTLDALHRLASRARGIAVIDDKTTATDLDRMARAGVRGIRVNLETIGETDPAIGRLRFEAAVERVMRRNWHIQIYTRLAVIDAIKEAVIAAPVPVVFDHFGGAKGALGVNQAGFDVLLDLVRSGKAYVKLSAPYRSSTEAPDYPDMAPLAHALIAANPLRILWGSDWPHPDTRQMEGRRPTDPSPRLPIDDGRVLNQLAVWAPEAAQRRTILVDNPATLYGF